MRMTNFLAVGLALTCLAGVTVAQCAAPHPTGAFETFDVGTTASTSGSCSSTAPGTFPAGWANDATTNVAGWRLRSGSTSSGGTGPSGDHTTGSGIYVYIESSTPCNPGVTMILNAPPFDATTVAVPTVEFFYNLNGAAMGSLDLEMFDGTVWTSVFSTSGQQGDNWKFASVDVTSFVHAGTSCGAEVKFRFVGVTGSSFTSDMAIDDVRFGEPTPIPFAINTPTAAMDVDGVQGDPFTGVVVNKSVFACPTTVPATGSFNLSASDNPGAFYEVLFSANPVLIPVGFTVGGEIVNIDISAPLTYLNGGGSFLMEALPGASLPGSTGGSISTAYALSSAVDTALQGTFTSPAGASGFETTQGTEFHVALTAPATSVAGPTGDDQTLTYNMVAGATCWTAAGLPFYGTLATELHVDSNGRVMTAFDGSDFSPSLGEAQSGPPTAGVWQDLSPNNGGTITLSNPSPGIVRVDWVGVPNFGAAASANTFGVELDEATGRVVIDGLATGLDALNTSSSVFLGMTPGGGATDPGALTFGVGGAPGGAGIAGAATDMLYDFATTALGLPASVNGTLAAIEFLAGLGNYAWQGL